MSETSITSIIFVINAAYYYTFVNSIVYSLTKDQTRILMSDNVGLTFEKTICCAICLVMTLRFFLGNTQYITLVMRDAKKIAWIKFYHFFFVWMESLVLLLSSYFLGDTNAFLWIIIVLFGAEVFWYLITLLIDHDSVTNEDAIKRPSFFEAQMLNIVFVVLSVPLLLLRGYIGFASIIVICILFLLNTVYDAIKNMNTYMGHV